MTARAWTREPSSLEKQAIDICDVLGMVTMELASAEIGGTVFAFITTSRTAVIHNHCHRRVTCSIGLLRQLLRSIVETSSNPPAEFQVTSFSNTDCFTQMNKEKTNFYSVRNGSDKISAHERPKDLRGSKHNIQLPRIFSGKFKPFTRHFSSSCPPRRPASV